MKIPEFRVREFQEKIFKWWKENKRNLPWRETTDPYLIMVSEIMLQQTQVSRTIEKYNSFIKKFPTLESLARASPAEVLKEWSGLGYNRRAIWLQQAAQLILERNSFPNTPEELVKLKGIGEYTSRSILIFAFNADLSTIDTNIRRILIAEGFASEQTSEKELLTIAAQLLPSGKARDWHNALMDYGSILLTAQKTGIKPLSKQPIYKKSTRYFRGKIVKLLTFNNRLTEQELITKIKLSNEELQKILESLIKDNLITKNEEGYSLPKK